VLASGYAYFANSYRATEAPGWLVATAEHGGSFVAAVERGNIVGCQFHPELSGSYGANLLQRFIELEPC
jgi:imidazoleglycerol phosphate synthase glutamine amidotransferase subunit HisH